jgi:hypothetical protein
MTYHLIPMNDLKEHSLSPECFCQPVLSSTEPFTCYDHNAVDGREATERRTGKAIKNKGWIIKKEQP